MSQAPKRDNSTPSLFPFLAVLLCTMGALVLLLVLIVSKAQASAKQLVTEKKQQVEELETQIDLARDKMQSQLEQGRLDLEKKRLALQGLEQQIRELTEELTDLKRTATLLDQETSTTAEQERETEEKISKLEEQLSEATTKLKKQIDKPAGNKPIFAIIPYEGTNGTHRRPVYLECTDKGVVIQPEGVILSLNDLAPPYGPGNPLDASIRTIRARYTSSNQSLTSSAYPLLVVRPSGVRTYALARQAIASWDDQFGYELIDESLELAFPEGEPGLATEIEQAIATARERQAALVMAMPGKYRQFISRQGQGVENIAFGEEESDFGNGWVPSGNGSGGSGSGNGSGGGTKAGSGTGPGRGGFAQNGSFAAGNSASGVGPEGVAGFANNAQNASGQVTSSGQPVGGSPTGQGNRYFGFGDGSSESRLNVESDSTGSTGGASSRQGAGGQGNYAVGSNGGGNSSTGTGSGGGGIAGGGPGGSSAMGGSSSPSASQSGGGSQSLQNDQFTPNDNSSDPTRPLQVQKSVGGDSRVAQGDSQSSTGSSSSGSDFSQPDSRSSTTSSKRNAKAEPIARQRGRNWAWSEGPPSKKAFVRAVRVVCYSDRWVIMPDSAVGSKQVTINLDNGPQVSAEKLAKTIASRVEGWGIAFSDGYWKPELIVDVAPDAEARYVQMAQMLEGSGLEVRRRSTTK
jgi:hypothetical protein